MLAGLLQDLGVLCLAQAESGATCHCCARHATTSTWFPASARRWAAATPTSAPGWPSNGACHVTWWSISHSEDEDAAESPFQACVQLSGAVADIWLDNDADAARAPAQVHDRLELDARASTRCWPASARPCRHRQPVRCRPQFAGAGARADRSRAGTGHAAQPARTAGCRPGTPPCRRGARQALADQAHRDALTGVLNRRQLEAVLEQEFLRAGRQGWPLSVAFIAWTTSRRSTTPTAT